MYKRQVDGHRIKVEVPIRFRGISPGVKLGGKLIQSVRRVKIKTLPEDLVEEVIVDISTLDLGQSLRVSCLLYTSDAADERSSVDLGGRRIIKKKTPPPPPPPPPAR